MGETGQGVIAFAPMAKLDEARRRHPSYKFSMNVWHWPDLHSENLAFRHNWCTVKQGFL